MGNSSVFISQLFDLFGKRFNVFLGFQKKVIMLLLELKNLLAASQVQMPSGDAPSREEVVPCETLQDFLELNDQLQDRAFRQAFVSKRAYHFNRLMRN